MIAKQTLLGFLLLALPLLALRADEEAADDEKKADPGEVRIILSLDDDGKTTAFLRKKHLAKLKLPEAVVIADDLKITHAGVCTFTGKEGSPLEAIPAKEIPMVPRNRFGWIFRADTTRDSVALEELFTVPGNPNWNSNVKVSSDDPNTAKVERKENVWDWVWRSWLFEDSDPTGKHAFTLKFGELTIPLEFQVVAPKQGN